MEKHNIVTQQQVRLFLQMLFFTACVVYDEWKGKNNSKATARQAARADGQQQTLHCNMTDCIAEALGNSLAFPQQHNNHCLLWQA